MQVDPPGNGSLRLSDGRVILVFVPAPVGSDHPSRCGLSMVTGGQGFTDIPRDDAVALGQWLIDTFGGEP